MDIANTKKRGTENVENRREKKLNKVVMVRKTYPMSLYTINIKNMKNYNQLYY